MPSIVPFLWFNDQAEEAVALYTSIFPNSSVGEILRCGEHGPGPVGSVLTISFRLGEQEFTAMNGGPMYTFNPAISLQALCETQEEIDYYWSRLSEGGEPVQCGWLTDKYGLSWQVTPTVLLEMIQDPDPARSARAFAAMTEMVKLDIGGLRRAFDGA